MAAWMLIEAREHLAAWLRADKALATGQSYRIGNRTLERVDVDEVKERISFWKSEVAKLEGLEGLGKRVRRSYRIIPRDL